MDETGFVGTQDKESAFKKELTAKGLVMSFARPEKSRRGKEKESFVMFYNLKLLLIICFNELLPETYQNLCEMIYEFIIIKVFWHHNRGNFIFARHLGDMHDFCIPDDSLFGDMPVDHYREMGPINDENGIPQNDVFVLHTFKIKRLDEHFTEGQIVKLVVG